MANGGFWKNELGQFRKNGTPHAGELVPEKSYARVPPGGGRGGYLFCLFCFFPKHRLAMEGSYLASRELPLSVRVSAPSPAHLPRLA